MQMYSNIQKLRNIDLTGYLLPADGDSPQQLSSTNQNRNVIAQSVMLFEEDEYLSKSAMDTLNEDLRKCKCPHLVVKRPYWQMRLIYNSIRQGGFISENIYLPKPIWSQHSLKLSGVAAKTTAFTAIISLVQNESFDIVNNILGLEKLNLTIVLALEEFYSIQNQLWKPFPFIPEIAAVNESESSSVQITSRLGSFMSSIKKGVKKYTSLGISRFNALPALLNADEITAYVKLISDLCNSIQVFDELYDESVHLRELLSPNKKINKISTPSSPVTSSSNTVVTTESSKKEQSSSSSSSSSSSWSSLMPSVISTVTATPSSSIDQELPKKLECLNNIINNLDKISQFMRVTVCELVMRDTEHFALKNLHRMTKGFAHVPDTEDDDDDDNSHDDTQFKIISALEKIDSDDEEDDDSEGKGDESAAPSATASTTVVETAATVTSL